MDQHEFTLFALTVDDAFKLLNDSEVSPYRVALSDTAATLIVPVKEASLRLSRTQGILMGKPAPRHRKLGRRVFYVAGELIDWMREYENGASFRLAREQRELMPAKPLYRPSAS